MKTIVKLILIAAIVVFVVLYLTGHIKFQERFQALNASVPGASNLVLADGNGNLSSIGFPSGLIMIWNPPASSVSTTGVVTPPPGWALCDGSNGTPDLRGRFVIGAGYSTTAASTTVSTTINNNKPITQDEAGNPLTIPRVQTYGGEEKHALEVNEMPRHSHRHLAGWYDPSPGGMWHVRGSPGVATAGNSTEWQQSAIEYTGGTGTATAESRGVSHNVRSPYYALVYIMKL